MKQCCVCLLAIFTKFGIFEQTKLMRFLKIYNYGFPDVKKCSVSQGFYVSMQNCMVILIIVDLLGI